MDIKDFILIGGGLLIAAVVAHGFWIAWRARRDPLRIDLVAELPGADDGDDLRRLRAELPNGGARVVSSSGPPAQGDLELDRNWLPGREEAPVLLDPSEAIAPREGGSSGPPDEAQPDDTPHAGRERAAARPAAPGRAKTEPRLGPAPEEPEAGRVRDKVKDVILPERTLKADEPKEPRRWPARKPAAENRGEQRPAPQQSRGGPRQSRGESPRQSRGESPRQGRGEARGGVQKSSGNRKPEQPVEELIMINVLSPRGKPFVGGGLVESLRARGLRYGDMNIFHRVDPMTRATLYSVANVVEPGTFDMADLDNFRSPGVCFFMQLPGPEQPLDVFEDMLKVARDVAVRVGGELKDEQRSVMTGQTVEHYRQRISDFCRRRMSMRA